MTVTGFFSIAAHDPSRTAVVTADESSITYGELANAAHRIGRGLQDLGLKAGDSVVILMPNGIEFLKVYLAGLECGLYVAPANWHLTGAEIAYIIDNSGASAFIAHADFAEMAVKAQQESGISLDRCYASGSIDGFSDMGELGAGEALGHRPEHRTLGAAMLYTSGTTGRPKGVRRPLTGQCPDLVPPANLRFFQGFGIDAPDNVHLCGSPLYHTAVLNFVVISLQLGQKVIVMDKWDAEDLLRLIDKYSVTQSHMVPTQFVRLLELDEDTRSKYDISSLRTVVHGAAPCPIHVKQEMMSWWGPVLTEYYAGTEGGGCTITGQEWLRKPGSVGQPWPVTTLRILSDDGSELPSGEIGEVYLEMGGSSFEYHKDREKTAESYRGSLFTMGDIGYVDGDGYLFLCDRKNDMIISGGVNIYPAEVESELHRHPAVRDVAVFGVPNTDWGEEVKAVIELSDGFEGSAAVKAEILSCAAQRLAKYKLPRSIDVVDQLPREANGKLPRRKLKKPYWT